MVNARPPRSRPPRAFDGVAAHHPRGMVVGDDLRQRPGRGVGPRRCALVIDADPRPVVVHRLRAAVGLRAGRAGCGAGGGAGLRGAQFHMFYGFLGIIAVGIIYSVPRTSSAIASTCSTGWAASSSWASESGPWWWGRAARGGVSRRRSGRRPGIGELLRPAGESRPRLVCDARSSCRRPTDRGRSSPSPHLAGRVTPTDGRRRPRRRRGSRAP